MEGVFKHRIFGMRRKEKARKEKKPVDWAYPIFRIHAAELAFSKIASRRAVGKGKPPKREGGNGGSSQKGVLLIHSGEFGLYPSHEFLPVEGRKDVDPFLAFAFGRRPFD